MNDEITSNCDLLINSHLHNGSQINSLKKCKLCGGEPLCTTYIPTSPPWKCTHGISCKECEAQTQRYNTYAEAYEEWQEMNEIKG